jgi:hypothetical protein
MELERQEPQPAALTIEGLPRELLALICAIVWNHQPSQVTQVYLANPVLRAGVHAFATQPRWAQEKERPDATHAPILQVISRRKPTYVGYCPTTGAITPHWIVEGYSQRGAEPKGALAATIGPPSSAITYLPNLWVYQETCLVTQVVTALFRLPNGSAAPYDYYRLEGTLFWSWRGSLPEQTAWSYRSNIYVNASHVDLTVDDCTGHHSSAFSQLQQVPLPGGARLWLPLPRMWPVAYDRDITKAAHIDKVHEFLARFASHPADHQ